MGAAMTRAHAAMNEAATTCKHLGLPIVVGALLRFLRLQSDQLLLQALALLFAAAGSCLRLSTFGTSSLRLLHCTKLAFSALRSLVWHCSPRLHGACVCPPADRITSMAEQLIHQSLESRCPHTQLCASKHGVFAATQSLVGSIAHTLRQHQH